MDRNTIIGLILIGAILIGYSVLTKPSREEIAERQRIADSIRIAQTAELLEKEKEVPLPVDSGKLDMQVPVSAESKKVADYGAFSEFATGSEEFFELENDLLKLTISTKGGRPVIAELKDYFRYDGMPVKLFEEDSTKFGLEFFLIQKPSELLIYIFRLHRKKKQNMPKTSL